MWRLRCSPSVLRQPSWVATRPKWYLQQELLSLLTIVEIRRSLLHSERLPSTDASIRRVIPIPLQTTAAIRPPVFRPIHGLAETTLPRYLLPVLPMQTWVVTHLHSLWVRQQLQTIAATQ